MTDKQKAAVLKRARANGYTGPNNLGNVWAWANSATAPTRVKPLTTRQTTAMNAIADSLAGSE
jgi:hypothetical protein